MSGIDVYRSHSLRNIFHLFFAAAKACLLPFITLYFRQLGLTATQTGIVIGVQLWLRIWVSPMWMRCAVRFNKKHFVLMFSIFIMMASSLFMTLIPPVDLQASLKYCRNGESIPHLSTNFSSELQLVGAIPFANGTSGNVTAVSYSHDVGLMNATEKATSTRSSTSSAATTSTVVTTTTTTAATTTNFVPIAPKNNGHLPNWGALPDSAYPSQARKPSHKSNNKGIHQSQPILSRLSSSDVALLKKHKIPLERLQGLNPKQLNYLINSLRTHENHRKHQYWGSGTRTRRSILEAVHTKLSQFHTHITELGITNPFYIVLVLIVIGELLSVHIDRFTDKMWFDFLDGIDDLERYGQYGLWSLVSFTVFPLVVTTLVDYTPCLLSYGINHFMIHFYMFAGLLGITFICSYWYPIRAVSSLKSIFRKNRFMKGCRILVGDMHCFSFAFSVLLSGLLFAGVDNFLFWHVQNIGGSEVIMGGAVSFAAAAEYIMYLSMNWFLSRLGHVAAMSLAMLVLAVRLLLYSFIWMPWMVIPLALLQAFTHALLWGAVCTYPDFKLNPSIMDRSAHWVLTSFHHGVGFAAGSVVAGYLYESFGFALVFQGAAGIAFVWLLIFMTINRFVKKVEAVRYERLLQADEEKNDESLAWEDDDWLESAMKDEV